MSPESNLSGYADDVTYSQSTSSTADETTVANDLASIYGWLSSNEFRLNTHKIETMMVSRWKTPPPMCTKLQGNQLELVDKFHLLGVAITSNLTCKLHIFEISSKAKRLLGFLYRVFREN